VTDWSNHPLYDLDLPGGLAPLISGRVERSEAHQPTQTIVTLSRGGMIGEGNFGLRS
jgi:hypothetical protein